MSTEDTNMAALADWAVNHATQPHVVTVTNPGLEGVPMRVPLLIVPDGSTGFKVIDVSKQFDNYRHYPERRTGTATMTDLSSFIAHVNRFKDLDSALFLDATRGGPGSPSLLAVLDYHQAVNVFLPSDLDAPDLAAPDPDVTVKSNAHARFGTHKTLYRFPLSDEWLAWTLQDGKPMEQGAFAEFLEDRINDITEADPDPEGSAAQLARKLGGYFASPSRMMELSRGLKIHVEHRYQKAVALSSGETQFGWTEEHKDEAGEPLVVPSLFQIVVPVFKNGAQFCLTARLRYRMTGTKVVWFYQLYKAEVTFDFALEEAAQKAQRETGLPMFVGKPEVDAKPDSAR